MTEKRSDYRKRQSKEKSKKFFRTVKSAFDDNQKDNVDVNPDFVKDEDERRPLEGNGEKFNQAESTRSNSEEKALRLKKRLNSAILIVFVLIVLVLLALFHL